MDHFEGDGRQPGRVTAADGAVGTSGGDVSTAGRTVPEGAGCGPVRGPAGTPWYGRPAAVLGWVGVLAFFFAFWILEDFLWFVLNPAFGLAKFTPAHVPWHKHWLLGVPADYLSTTAIGALLVSLSYRRKPFGWRRLLGREA